MQVSILNIFKKPYPCSMSKRTKAPPHPALSAIRHNVRKAITEQGYSSVEKFSHENALEQSVLSRFLAGRNDILLSTYLRIVSALNMDVEASALPMNLSDAKDDGDLRINLSDASAIRIYTSANDAQPLFSIQKGEHVAALSIPVPHLRGKSS